MSYACPCCGYLTFGDEPPGTFEVCPVCFWEDDELQFRDPSYEHGANGISLEQARKNFVAIGAISRDNLQYVRDPLPNEIPD